MKFSSLLAAAFVMAVSSAASFAVPSGKTVDFAGGDSGPVVFDGKTHADKGLKCADCHSNPKLFARKKGEDKITMADMNAGKFCGACHDGTKSFKSDDKANCTKCHKK